MKFAEVSPDGTVTTVIEILGDTTGLPESYIPLNENLPQIPNELFYDTNLDVPEIRLAEEHEIIKPEEQPLPPLRDEDVNRIAAEVVKQLNAANS